MRSRLFTLVFLAILTGVTVTTPSAATAQTAVSARIAFLHLSADAPSLDIYIDGGRAVTNLAFGGTSPYFAAAGGSHKIQVTTTGHIDPLLSASGSLEEGRSYTWVFSGLISAADVNIPLPADLQFTRYLQLGDNAGDPSDPRPRLRVANASPGAGPVDVRIDVAEEPPVATNLSYGNVSAYTNLASGSYTVSVYTSANGSLLASINTDSLQEHKAYTLVLGGVLPGVVAANPRNAVQGFQPVKLTDQNSLKSALLTKGCNQVVVSLPVGTPLQSVVGRVDQSGLVTSIWRYDNVTKLLRAGYFGDPRAPIDITLTLSSPEAIFICISSSTTWNPTT